MTEGGVSCRSKRYRQEDDLNGIWQEITCQTQPKALLFLSYCHTFFFTKTTIQIYRYSNNDTIRICHVSDPDVIPSACCCCKQHSDRKLVSRFQDGSFNKNVFVPALKTIHFYTRCHDHTSCLFKTNRCYAFTASNILESTVLSSF